jgi:hypothetical protein
MQKELGVTFLQTGDDTSLRRAIAELPTTLTSDRGVLSVQITTALYDRNWIQARSLLQQCSGKDNGFFGYANLPVPIGCYSILLARLRRAWIAITSFLTSCRGIASLLAFKVIYELIHDF